MARSSHQSLHVSPFTSMQLWVFPSKGNRIAELVAASIRGCRIWVRRCSDGFWTPSFCNVKPGLINPKGLLNWGGYHLCIILWLLDGTPTSNKPWFINPELTLLKINVPLYWKAAPKFDNSQDASAWKTPNLKQWQQRNTHHTSAQWQVWTWIIYKVGMTIGNSKPRGSDMHPTIR